MYEASNDKQSELAVVLNIIEGSGLNWKKRPVVIEASLGGNILETSTILPGDLTTQFDCNLIWAADKNSVKQMRDENLPIKLRCFSVAPNGIRDSIGFVLIQMRTVVYSHGRKLGNVKRRWHKLLGVNVHWKQQKPELLLAISLVDKNNIDDDNNLSDEAKKLFGMRLATDVTYIHERKDPSSMLSADGDYHIRVLKEGLIQIGDQHDDCYQFHVIIHLRRLEQWQEVIEPNQQDGSFKLRYTLFGNPTDIDLQALENNCYLIDEKITIKFRSTLRMLKSYLKAKFTVPIEVLWMDSSIGDTILNFGESMIPLPDSAEEFMQIYSSTKSTFLLEDYSKIRPSQMHSQGEAKLYYTFAVKLIMGIDVATTYSPNRNTYQSTSPFGLAASNDHRQSQNAVSPRKEKAPDDAIKIMSPLDIHLSPVASPKRASQPKSLPLHSLMTNRSDQRTFAYTLVFIDCKFDRKVASGIWQISLNHSNADNQLVIKNFSISEFSNDTVELNNLSISLSFTTEKSRLVETIVSHPCLIVMKGPKGFRAIAELENESILAQNKITGIVVLENDHEEHSAMAHVYVELTDLGPNFNNHDRNGATRKRPQHTSRIDEDLAYKAIEELEEWKKKQMEDFETELKRREINLLAHLSNEWQRRRVQQETILASRLDHCDKLTKSLDEAFAVVREQSEMGLTREQYWVKTRYELEMKCKAKINELQNHVKELELEANRKLKEDELKHLESTMRTKLLGEENAKLRGRVRELEVLVQSSLPKEQVVELYSELATLNEKNERIQNTKLFYKKQWTRAMHELHYRKIDAISVRRDHSSHRDDFYEIIDSARIDLILDKDELQDIKSILARYS